MGFWYSTPEGEKHAEKDGGSGPDDHMEPTFERPYVKPTTGGFAYYFPKGWFDKSPVERQRLTVRFVITDNLKSKAHEDFVK